MSEKQLIEKTIDIEHIIAEKSPKMAYMIPGFMLRYLKKVLHEDDINEFLSRAKHLYGLPFVDAIIENFNPKISVTGFENIPENERVIVASNHPLGGLDGVALMHVIGKKREDILFPVNDILLYLENLKPLFIPINKHGSNTENVKILNDTFEGKSLICYFPYGLCSRKKHGKIMDLEWKKTFVTKARHYKRNVIPTQIIGKNSNFFYNLSNFRKRLGIKFNIEMLYLPDELFNQYDKPLDIIFGKPIPWQELDKRHTDSEWATLIRNYSYKLATAPDLVFDPNANYTFD